MISRTAEYALRTVVCLAGRPDEGSLSTSAIATATQVPAGYLSKVIQALTRAGLVTSVPGRRGGISLVRDPADMTLLDVVRAVTEWPRIEVCPLGRSSREGSLCPLHRRIDDAMSAAQHVLEGATVADMVREGRGTPPLCGE